MKKISIYVKGDRNSTDYYRIYQYFDKINSGECVCKYRIQLGNKLYRKWMPIADKPLLIKVFAFFYIYFRRLWSLLVDFVPLRVSLVFTLPIPVRYRLAPALVLTVPFSRDNFIPSESEVKRRVSSANSGSFTVTFCADALVSVARAMTNDKNNFFICNDILLLYICKDT